jgi:hypothetical protein
MRLYHFLEARWALDDLSKRRLRVSNIMGMNDPFEFMALALPSREARKRIMIWRHMWSEQSGLLCFSQNRGNPLLWSHYGERHAGICLGFDVEVAERVHYVERRTPEILLKASAHPTGSDRLMPALNALLTTKFVDWSYEDEARVFVPLSECNREGDHLFTPFSPNLVLREIALGPVCPLRPAEVGAAFGDLAGVDCYRTRLAFNSFRVVRNRAAV